MNNPKFQLFKSSANSEFYFRLKASNGEIILGSEGYKTKQSCQAGVSAVKINASLDIRYERNNSFNNYSFNLKSANGEIIGRSENYSTLAAREVGIAAVKKDAPDAGVENLGDFN